MTTGGSRSGRIFLTGSLVFLAVAVSVSRAGLAGHEALNAVFLDALTSAAGDGGEGGSSLAQLLGTAGSIPEAQGLNSSCFSVVGNYSHLRACLLNHQCVCGENVARLYGTTLTSELRAADVWTVAPALLYVLTQTQWSSACTSSIAVTALTGAEQPSEAPSTATVWGYSFLFVTLINLCSLLGALLVPCMGLRSYRLILTFLVALAVGTLVGSGLLVLIPEALDLTHGDDLAYLWKTATVMGGIYLFFVLERVMKIIDARRQRTSKGKPPDQSKTQDNSIAPFTIDPHRGDDAHPIDQPASHGTDTRTQIDGSSCGHHSGHHDDNGHAVAPVAYMVVVGDALHNLIDGLSIGAAFTSSTLLGISVAVAVLCEELPHELGDFAILLNSGMSARRALFYNFLSSLSCYIGLVIGIVLGENTSANAWVFAVAGGMFLYISLASMLPEMSSSAESEEFGKVRTFILQNVGLLSGFGIIFLLAVFGREISFE